MPEQAFQPEWFSKPGDTLRTLLDRRDLSPVGLAECMGRDASVIHGLLSGSVSIDDSLAGQLAWCVGGSATFWKTRQQQFDEDLRRIAEAVPTEQAKAWLKTLPIKDMVTSGWLPTTDRPQDLFRAVLTYFDVNDPDEWRERYAEFQNRFSFRTSPAFESKLGALAAWLRQAEILAGSIPCQPWSTAELRARLQDMRVLTKATNLAFVIPRLRALCAEVGIAIVFLRAPAGCSASGATRFLSSTKAMIVLSFRHLSDDQFWFSFFHEIGHLLMHGDRSTFVDGEAADVTEKEKEANAFSESLLVPLDRQEELATLRTRARDVIKFAVSVGISPGIVVGQMQYRRMIGPQQLNFLKRRYGWDEILAAVA
jgi:Zn-dependent peptidase ImmA (M78 family)/plasmid maintenance system antidote protein VapI